MKDINPQQFSGTKVLVVDDASQVHSVLKRFLEARDFEYIGAYDAQEAITKFIETKPGAVFLDIALPGRNGLEVLQLIHRADPKVGVIMITGLDEGFLKDKVQKLGAFAFITKPFDFAELERVLLENLSLESPDRGEAQAGLDPVKSA